MKKTRILSSLLTTLAGYMISTSVAAYPITNNANFTCPEVSAISNFGNYVAGFGSEVMLNQTNPVYFQSQYP